MMRSRIARTPVTCISWWGENKQYTSCQLDDVCLTSCVKWVAGYDTVLMHRYIQGDSLYIPDRFGVHGKLYIEVTMTWYFTFKYLNWLHHHAHWVWRSWKISITFDLQGIWMIPLGDHFQRRHKNGISHQNGRLKGDSLYIPDRFGVEGELYVEVMRNWCSTAKDLNWPHHHGQQVWCRRKPFIMVNHKVRRWYWLTVKSVVLTLLEEGVKIWGTNLVKMELHIKMIDLRGPYCFSMNYY